MGSTTRLGGAPEIDVLLIGAGFSSFSLCKKLYDLNLNLKIKIYEKAPTSGGIWYWNCYPGARVDSPSPVYQLFSKELYTTFNFTERYPSGPEIAKYFKHVEKTWNLSKDIVYNKHVTGANFDEARRQWRVQCADGSEVYCRWLVPGLGIASKRYEPDFPGFDTFKGEVYHTSVWPQEGVEIEGKKIAVVGTGATGVQVIQELGDKAGHMTVFQRTPNLCIAMQQRKLDQKEEEEKKKSGKYEEIFEICRKTLTGFQFGYVDRNAFDDTPEQREEFLQSLWDEGGFYFWQATYKDMLYDQRANDEVYRFWRSKVLQRITDPKKAALLAPEKPPHPYGTKRPSLEQRFYEVIDQPHIDIVDINTSPITSITPTGIVTKNNGEIPVDIIILATGFDIAYTISALNLVGLNNHTIHEHWAGGISTSMGIALAGFPNMFMMYGPHSPTAFGNGPSVTQFQAEWIAETIGRLEREDVSWFEARAEMEVSWREKCEIEWEKTLFPKAKSWYQGSNIPGRKVEALFWCGGLISFMEALRKSNENNYQGWIVKKEKAGSHRN